VASQKTKSGGIAAQRGVRLINPADTLEAHGHKRLVIIAREGTAVSEKTPMDVIDGAIRRAGTIHHALE
jgi:hypothetical protein